jgi:hypothetical protein
VLLEDAGAVSELGDRCIPVAALADRELQGVLGGGRRGGCGDEQGGGECDPDCFAAGHGCGPV